MPVSVVALFVVVVVLQDPLRQPDVRVVLKDGSDATGSLIERSRDAVTIDLGKGQVGRYRTDEIERVDTIPAETPQPIQPASPPALPPADAAPAVGSTAAEPLPDLRGTAPEAGEIRCAVFITEGNIGEKLVVFQRMVVVRKMPLRRHPSDATMFERLAAELKAARLDGAAGVRVSRPKTLDFNPTTKVEGMAFVWTDAGRTALPSLLAEHRGHCY